MRKAVLVGVIALLAAGAFVVVNHGGRILALSVGGAFILASVPLMALARIPLLWSGARGHHLRRERATVPTHHCETN